MQLFEAADQIRQSQSNGVLTFVRNQNTSIRLGSGVHDFREKLSSDAEYRHHTIQQFRRSGFVSLEYRKRVSGM